MTQNLEFMTFTEVYKFNLEEGKNTDTMYFVLLPKYYEVFQ